MLNLNNASPLAFTLRSSNGTIATVGEAARIISKLSEEKRTAYHWKTAILMLQTALKEPRYLTTATVNLETAMSMDGLLSH